MRTKTLLPAEVESHSVLLLRRRGCAADVSGAVVAEYRFVEVLGCRLRTQSLGQGTLAIVFVPDPPNVLEHHAEAFARLAPEIRVVGIELPGFGFSTPSASFRYTIRENAEVLLATLGELGVERAVLSLSCVAGLISVAAAQLAGNRVAGIVAIQTADLEGALRWSHRVDPKRIVRTPWVGQAFVRLNRRRIAKGWYDAVVADPSQRPHYLSTATDAFSAGARYALASGLQGLAKTDEGTVLQPALSLPAMAVWGTEDRTHRRTDRAGLRRYLPKIEVVELDRAGHFPELEAEPRFRRALLDWMVRATVG